MNKYHLLVCCQNQEKKANLLEKVKIHIEEVFYTKDKLNEEQLFLCKHLAKENGFVFHLSETCTLYFIDEENELANHFSPTRQTDQQNEQRAAF